MEPFKIEAWHDFFVTVGGGAAALTGLVVVAMSMHLEKITRDAALRHRARMILAGLAGAFIRCSLALMGGQGTQAVGAELFLVCLGLQVLNVFSFASVASNSRIPRTSLLRTIAGISCYAIEMVGAAMLFFGMNWGLTLAAVAMMTNFFFMMSSSWLLLLGVRHQQT